MTINDRKIAVINVKLHSNDTSKRKKQVAQVLKFLDLEIIPFYRFYVITGDFGEGSDGENINMLRKWDRVREIFSALERPKPISTHVSGLCLDHIFVSPMLARHAKEGAYFYYTAISAHLAVLADFLITRKRLWRPRKTTSECADKPTFANW